MILCYHAIDPQWRSSLSVAPDVFAGQCAWLSSRRRAIDLDAAMEHVLRRGRLPRGTACLTFDDGFASVLDHGLPILEAHGLPSAVFLVSATLAPGGRVVDWVDDPPPTPPATLDAAQVLDMQERGVSFGAHTVSHPDLTALGDRECLAEMRDSREQLSDLLGRNVRWLAFPRGRQTARVRRLAAQAGYDGALSLAEIPDSLGPFAVPRIGVYATDTALTMRMKTTPAYAWARRSSAFPRLRSAVTRRTYVPRWTPPASG